MPTAAASRKLLLVDDDSQILQVLHRKFSARGVDAHECADGQQALDALKQSKYDGVLLDLKMPHVDGYTVLGELSQTLNADTPVYVLTSLPNDIASERARELGADRILSKHEFSPQKVVELVCEELLRSDEPKQ